jgi:hypothetical protein
MHNNHNPRPRNRLQHSKRLDPIHRSSSSSADHSGSYIESQSRQSTLKSTQTKPNPIQKKQSQRLLNRIKSTHYSSSNPTPKYHADSRAGPHTPRLESLSRSLGRFPPFSGSPVGSGGLGCKRLRSVSGELSFVLGTRLGDGDSLHARCALTCRR